MSLGGWNVDVVTGGMPQKVATAFGALSEQLIGAEYTPIAYLGSQLVNGTNHAVLAEQLLTTGKDTKNVVLLIFNEKGMDCNLVNIERVVTSGEGAGAISIDVKTDIPEEAAEAFNKVVGAWVGAEIEPFALLGSQVVSGIDYIFAAEVTLVLEEPVKKVSIVTINSLAKTVTFKDIL